MKILQVNCVYNKGSTGKIVFDIHRELLENGIDSIVLYGRGVSTNDKNVYKTCSELYSKANNLLSRFTGLMYGGCFFSTNRLISIIKKKKPDVVHLHCINGYFVNIYRLISFLKKSGIKTVLTLHAEFMYTASCGYSLDCDKWKNGCGKCPLLKQETKSYLIDGTHRSWIKMKKAFDGFENLTVASVSPWLMNRASESPILKGKNHTVVLNGLDTSVFHYRDSEDLKKKHGISNEKIIMHVTSNFNNTDNHIKGGLYIIELAKMMPEVKFIIAGSYNSDIQVPDNVILLGRISNQNELAKYYSLADLTVIASKKETFSMVCMESLCCGTPVVGFLSGGPEGIFSPKYSAFVEYGNVQALCEKANELLNTKFDKGLISRQSTEQFSQEKMASEYIKLYK